MIVPAGQRTEEARSEPPACDLLCMGETAANAVGKGGEFGRPVSEELTVECWCQAVLLSVPSSEIRAGRTMSCGAEGCHDDGEWR